MTGASDIIVSATGIPHSALTTPHLKMGLTTRLALPRGINARQFTKLLLSLLSHAGLKRVGRSYGGMS